MMPSLLQPNVSLPVSNLLIDSVLKSPHCATLAFTATADKMNETIAKHMSYRQSEAMSFYKQQLAKGCDHEEAAKRAKKMKDAMALFLDN